MDLTLYRRLRREVLETAGLGLVQGDGTHVLSPGEQRRLEALSRDLGLPSGLMARVDDVLTQYNRLLTAIGRDRVRLRYYQVLALLFTEQALAPAGASTAPPADRRTFAYWMATGSGKTIVMHLNLLQRIADLARRGVDYDRLEVIVTTPGVNLIEQHRRELVPLVAALNAELQNRIALTVDTTQALLLRPRTYFDLPAGTARVQRVVMVDEAHIGLSAAEGEFQRLRRRLAAEHTLLLEYSATYYNLGRDLEREYDASIVYVYDYARFFRDSYGKDYHFRQVAADVVKAGEPAGEDVGENLRACFAALEAKLVAHERVHALAPDARDEWFPVRLPDRPLLAFMGNTVEDRAKAGQEGKDDEVSDIKKVLYFLAGLSLDERRAFARVFRNGTTGKLVVQRNPTVEDELLLSYGEGEPWGLVNVGGGDRFVAGLEHPAIDKRVDQVRDPSALFANLDDAASPINVLVGSRKFAEGWNSFRVSAIGLINLGKTRGNKVIQIFGRGVRLRGARGDGKRRDPAHHADYGALGDSLADDVRRLETLVVLSLQKSYLETFVNSLEVEVKPTYSFRVPVAPIALRGPGGREAPFDVYRRDLPIFKLAPRAVGHIRAVLDDGRVRFSYADGDGVTERELERARFDLDYHTDVSAAGADVLTNVRRQTEALWPADGRAGFLDAAGLVRHVTREAAEAGLALFARADDGGRLTPASPMQLLPFVGSLKYAPVTEGDVRTLDRLLRRASSDVIAKLRNRLRTNINQEHYVFTEPLNQATDDAGGDFIHEYSVTLTFDTRAKHDAFVREVEEAAGVGVGPLAAIRGRLALPSDPPHIYAPLLDEAELAPSGERVSPDLLNPGERKFVADLAEYVARRFAASARYRVYLLRNVESLRRIGIYLESDEGVFYPDFVLWVVDDETAKTYVVFADPKGQRDIQDDETLGISEKARVGRRDHAGAPLRRLEERLSAAAGRTVEIHSFLLLRDSSPYGRDAARNPARLAQMLENNLLRLDWHTARENGDASQPLAGRTYLDIMFDTIGVT